VEWVCGVWYVCGMWYEVSGIWVGEVDGQGLYGQGVLVHVCAHGPV